MNISELIRAGFACALRENAAHVNAEYPATLHLTARDVLQLLPGDADELKNADAIRSATCCALLAVRYGAADPEQAAAALLEYVDALQE